MKEVGIGYSVNKNVENLSQLALNCGLDGIVCSPMEIEKIKNAFGSKLKLIVPGIRNNKTDDIDDQKRTLSAKEAINSGADIIVIGQ